MSRYFLTILLLLMAPFTLATEVNGQAYNLFWAVPFIGILLSIALGPTLFATFWHHHYGKISLMWVVTFLIPFIFSFGGSAGTTLIAYALFEEYIPFIVLLLTLFTVSGGILIKGNLHGSPKLNTGILVIGTLLASVMGTTGAAMLLIRPLLRANDNRKHNVHVVVFFLFLVANIGGGLTPLGDPPLFLGFLKGVDFFWTVKHMALPVLFMSVSLLVIFYLLDSYYYHQEEEVFRRDNTPDSTIRIEGKFNFLLLIAIVGSVLLSGIWKPNVTFNILGTPVQLQNLVRDGLLIIITFISIMFTSSDIRQRNDFNWQPIVEVAKLFAAIFITITPVIAILRLGYDGDLATLIAKVNDDNQQPINMMYFWMTGSLSAFLDNAPTYLVFFNLASGDAGVMMNALATTLTAISMGAVFMGAMTYVGNAPNFMVRSIAIQQGVNMPSFFGYMKWSIGILVPLFILLSWLFFH